MLLAGHEQRVEDASAVVDRDVPQEPHLPRFDVHLDDCDVRAERIRRLALVEVERRGQRRFHAGRASGVVVGSLGELGPTHRGGGDSGDRESSLVERDVGDVGLQEVRGELLGLPDHRLAGFVEGAPRDLQ